MEKSLPVFNKTSIFNDISELSEGALDKYSDKEPLAMQAFPENISITDHPYKKEGRIFKRGFSKNSILKIFNELNEELDKHSFSRNNRTFLLFKAFGDVDVKFSGQIWKKENKLIIDFFNGNMPSGRDWNPHHSEVVNIENPKILESEYAEITKRILKDIGRLDEGAYLDFSLLNNGDFFYHDLSFH